MGTSMLQNMQVFEKNYFAKNILLFHLFLYLIRVNFLGLAEIKMFIDIWIRGFDTRQWVLLLFMSLLVN